MQQGDKIGALFLRILQVLKNFCILEKYPNQFPVSSKDLRRVVRLGIRIEYRDRT